MIPRKKEGEKDDRGGAERSSWEESKGEVQRRRHDRRSEEAGGGADGNESGEDSNPEVVQHLQGSHHSQGLRDPRRHGSRALLQLRFKRVQSELSLLKTISIIVSKVNLN